MTHGDGIIKVTEFKEMIKITKDSSVRKFAEEATKAMVAIMDGEQKLRIDEKVKEK